MRSLRFTRHRSSRRSRRPRPGGFLAGLAIVVLALIAAVVFGEKSRRDRQIAMMRASAGVVEDGRGVTPASDPGVRKVYPYSIIEGGATSVDELKRAIESDPVVAEHFKQFDLSKTRVERLEQPRIAHVSYRKGDDVFWTRKRVVIPAGETVLTDGTNYARTRCGNCLSTAPAAPVSDHEPPAVVLETPVMRRVDIPTGTISGPRTVGPIGSIASHTPGGGTPGSTSGPAPLPPGGGTPGASSGPEGTVSTPPGLEVPGDEVSPGNLDDPGDPGEQGSDDPGDPGNPNNPGDPRNPGNPGNPQDPPFVPPTGGDPLLPPIPEGPFDPPGDPDDPFDPPTKVTELPNDPNDPDDPNDPGDPGEPGTPIQSIPEPGTTALLLLGGFAAARRLRRRVP